MPRRQSQSSSYNKGRRFSSVPANLSPPPPSQSYTKGNNQPGVFGQMAATAGGVAVGSAVGHTVGRVVTGMFSGGSHQGQTAVNQGQKYEEPTGPCAWEIKQFLDCAATHSDINLCQGFNEAIRACKEKNNLI